MMTETLRWHLAGRTISVPDAGMLPWRWFLELSRTRSGTGYGPNPIAYAEIEAYARLYRWPLEPRHVDLILALDRAWLDHAHQVAKQPSDGTKSIPKSSGQAINPELFDAVF